MVQRHSPGTGRDGSTGYYSGLADVRGMSEPHWMGRCQPSVTRKHFSATSLPFA